MKKILILLLVMILLVLPGVLAIEQNITNITGSPRYTRHYPSLRIEQLKYEPYPVTPGEYFDLWVKVKNPGDDDAKNVVIILEPEYPFSADVDYEKTFDKINAYSERLIKYKIRAAEDAVEGYNYLNLKTRIGSGFWVEHQMTIEVRALDLLLDITNVSINKLSPGMLSTLTMTLENNGMSLVRDINIELDIDASTIPIVPVGSTSKKKIYSLPAQSSKTMSFDLMATAGASAEVYKVPIIVTYYDETGVKYVKNETIGLLVGAEPDLEINVEEADVFGKSSKGKVTLAVSNIGPSDIKFLTLELLDDDKYEILSAVKRSYLGNIDSDDFETVSFDIFTKAGFLDKKVMLKVLIEYKDAFNQEKSEVVEVPLKVFSSFELSKYELKKKRSFMSIFIFLIVVIVIYQVVRDWRKTKDIHKSVKKVLREDIFWVRDVIRKIKWRYIKRIPRKIRIFLRNR